MSVVVNTLVFVVLISMVVWPAWKFYRMLCYEASCPRCGDSLTRLLQRDSYYCETHGAVEFPEWERRARLRDLIRVIYDDVRDRRREVSER